MWNRLVENAHLSVCRNTLTNIKGQVVVVGAAVSFTGGSVGCGGGRHCYCHQCSSFCNTLSVLQNSNLAIFVCLNMRFGMLLQGRNVKWKPYLIIINEGEKMLSV